MHGALIWSASELQFTAPKLAVELESGLQIGHVAVSAGFKFTTTSE